jgi:hypothetical protein
MTTAPLLVILSAPPGTPGAADSIAAARARAASGDTVELLMSDAGLAFAQEESLRGEPNLQLSVCSADARDAGWTLDSAPPDVHWSALTTALRESDARPEIWWVGP